MEIEQPKTPTNIKTEAISDLANELSFVSLWFQREVQIRATVVIMNKHLLKFLRALSVEFQIIINTKRKVLKERTQIGWKKVFSIKVLITDLTAHGWWLGYLIILLYSSNPLQNPSKTISHKIRSKIPNHILFTWISARQINYLIDNNQYSN